MEEVKEAAAAANIHSFIAALPEELILNNRTASKNFKKFLFKTSTIKIKILGNILIYSFKPFLFIRF